MEENRRPVASRNTSWAARISTFLKNAGVSPNTISISSSVFALIGATAFIMSCCAVDPVTRGLWLVLGLAGILGRLCANLFDGMVAVEGGLKTPAGELFNDIPDRISDLVLLVAAGYVAAQGVEHPELWIQLGWAAGALAIMTAYLRFVGAAQGVGHFFLGPFAKQQRMAALNAACVLSIALEPHLLAVGTIFRTALGAIVLGSIVTCIRRVRAIAGALNKKG
ncbi:MAG: CDP-alcohol phosphatidyltransferase family protein [Chitinophagaceae bacterium]|nr:CDP-alcohol phosphatidyltransferase family protein [Oligoflexus sp.]